MGFVYRVLWFLMSLWIVLSETITILRKLHEVKIFGIPIFLTRVMYIAPFSGHTLFNLNLCLKLFPSYVHKPVVNFSGHPKFYFANFSKYWWFQTKRFTRLLQFIKVLWNKTHYQTLYFQYLQKLYLWMEIWIHYPVWSLKEILISFMFYRCPGKYLFFIEEINI